MDSIKPLVYIGIDIAKLTFDACLVRAQGKPQKKSFPNTQEGFAKLMRWVTHLAADATCHYCMEATGSYYEALAVFLAEANQWVSVVNPHRTHHSAKASGVGNKTDPAEAHLVAEYCRKENPPIWRRAMPEVRTLVAMMRRLQALKDHLIQEQNRLSDPSVVGQPSVIASLRRVSPFWKARLTAYLARLMTISTRIPILSQTVICSPASRASQR